MPAYAITQHNYRSLVASRNKETLANPWHLSLPPPALRYVPNMNTRKNKMTVGSMTIVYTSNTPPPSMFSLGVTLTHVNVYDDSINVSYAHPITPLRPASPSPPLPLPLPPGFGCLKTRLFNKTNGGKQNISASSRQKCERRSRFVSERLSLRNGGSSSYNSRAVGVSTRSRGIMGEASRHSSRASKPINRHCCGLGSPHRLVVLLFKLLVQAHAIENAFASKHRPRIDRPSAIESRWTHWLRAGAHVDSHNLYIHCDIQKKGSCSWSTQVPDMIKRGLSLTPPPKKKKRLFLRIHFRAWYVSPRLEGPYICDESKKTREVTKFLAQQPLVSCKQQLRLFACSTGLPVPSSCAVFTRYSHPRIQPNNTATQLLPQ